MLLARPLLHTCQLSSVSAVFILQHFNRQIEGSSLSSADIETLDLCAQVQHLALTCVYF